VTCFLIGVQKGTNEIHVRITVHNNPPARLLSTLLRFHRERFESAARLYEMRTCETCHAGAGDLREMEIHDDHDEREWRK